MSACLKALEGHGRSKYDSNGLHRCQRPEGHKGKCSEYPYLKTLATAAPKVKNKIVRDATKTTGASWKSEDAGPNRISRWTMQLTDSELSKLGIKMASLSPVIQRKLRDKAATYDECMEVAKKLTWLVYGMAHAPTPDTDTTAYLVSMFGQIAPGSTTCLVCKEPLDFRSFNNARRGKAEIETAHSMPRKHDAQNVGFAHRECNIAQGNKSLPEFYDWIRGILTRVDA